MNLHEYLFLNKMNATKFAEKCDLSVSYICALLRGTQIASKKTMRIISRVTKGKVTKIVPLPDPVDEQVA